jgi:predicted benzoate:H+ symporter BenE
MTREFANATALLIDWLRIQYAAREDAVLANVVVGATVPPTRTGSAPLVVVRRSGGVAELVRDRPRLDFMHWHSTEFKASAAAAITRALVLYTLPGQVLDGHTIYKTSEFSGPLPYPDPAGSNIPIVMLSVEIPIRIL